MDIARPLLRGICLVVKGTEQRFDRRRPPQAVAKFPRRPDSNVLSESIPLFFIGRNKCGFWVAREAGGRTGGLFLFMRSALRFAKKNSAAGGCATMFLTERYELDVDNQGSPLVAGLAAAVRIAARHMPSRAASIAAVLATARQHDKGGHR